MEHDSKDFFGIRLLIGLLFLSETLCNYLANLYRLNLRQS